MSAPPSLFRAVAYLMYWGWNLWFVAWLWLGLGWTVLGPMLVAISVGMVPLQFGVFGLLLLGVPALGLAVGLHPRVRTDPRKLLAILYGVEVPLMVLLAIRLFAVQLWTAPTALAVLVGLGGTAALARVVWSGPRVASRAGQIGLLVGASADLLAGWWLAALLALYSAPFLGLVLHAASVHQLWNELPFIGLLLFTALVLASFPLARIGLTTRTFELVLRATSEARGRTVAGAVAASTVAALVVAFAVAGQQPHTWAFAALEAADTDVERAALLAEREAIRRGLVFARLAPEETFDGAANADGLRQLYREAFGVDTDVPGAIANGLLSPFVLHPFHDRPEERWVAPLDVSEATLAYGAFFDVPIEVAEQDTLVAASRATWDWSDAHAGLLAAGQEKVHLAQQQITIEPRGDVARVGIHDVYRNRTWEQQEVLVYFSLPETAAITGLWLGTTADRAQAFPFVIAPRGAAQQVYEAQVRVRRDPALLEQVGPRQYRLRAFPVEPRAGDPRDVSSLRAEGPELHVWIDLVAPLTESGDGADGYALPVTTEVRNLFIDDESARTMDGRPFSTDGWMPEPPAASGARRAHDTVVGGWRVHAEPVGAVTPRRLARVAVLVDGTRSMDPHRDEIERGLARLRSVSDEVIVLCTREQVLARCPDFDPRTALAWGAAPLERRLAEAAALGLRADLVVALTDAGSYSLSADADAMPPITLPPLWLVHLGGFPAAYPDWTLDRLEASGGGIAATVDELLVRLTDPDVRDGWRWTVTPAADEPPSADPFAPLAARRLVAAFAKTHDLADPAELDALHGVALGAGIVTPWSSMIVLVDDAQRQMLAAASGAEDRFDREVIDAAEAPAFSSVPEPASMLLLALGAAATVLAGRRRRHEALSGS